MEKKPKPRYSSASAWACSTLWEIDEQIGALWVPAPGVGLRQRDCVRSLDDFSVFGQNSTSSTVESLAAGGVDEIAALIKTFAAATTSSVATRSRSAWCVDFFEVCMDYVGVDAGQVVGRTLDLEMAYKNLAPSLLAMPFGARNSVYGFDGFGKALQTLRCVLFWLPSSEYVDDFLHRQGSGCPESWSCCVGESSLTPRRPRASAQFSLHSVLSLTVLRLHVVHCTLKIGQAELNASCSC